MKRCLTHYASHEVLNCLTCSFKCDTALITQFSEEEKNLYFIEGQATLFSHFSGFNLRHFSCHEMFE